MSDPFDLTEAEVHARLHPDEPAPAPPYAGGAYYAIRRPTLGERALAALGFGQCASPLFDDFPDEHPDWAPGRLVCDTVVTLDWADRLRLLVSGRLSVRISSKTDVEVRRALSRSNVSVLPPSQDSPWAS